MMIKAILGLLMGPCLVLLAVECGTEKKDYLDRMSDEHRGDVPVANASTELESKTLVAGQEVTYATVNGKEIKGYLSTPEDAGSNKPGMIVIHEWWGTKR